MKKETAKDIARLIKGGADVTRVLHEEFKSMQFGHRLTCELPEHRERAQRMEKAKADRIAQKGLFA